MCSAIERVNDGESYRSTAADTPNAGRSTIMNIYNDEGLRAWYSTPRLPTGALTDCSPTLQIDAIRIPTVSLHKFEGTS